MASMVLCLELVGVRTSRRRPPGARQSQEFARRPAGSSLEPGGCAAARQELARWSRIARQELCPDAVAWRSPGGRAAPPPGGSRRSSGEGQVRRPAARKRTAAVGGRLRSMGEGVGEAVHREKFAGGGGGRRRGGGGQRRGGRGGSRRQGGGGRCGSSESWLGVGGNKVGAS
jgi:hypothetical protein